MVTESIRSLVIRSGREESVHLSAAALVDPAGEPIFCAGAVETPVYVRSTAKPFQAIALLASGAYERFNLTDEDLALACASHSGDPEHIRAVRAFMSRIGIGEDRLKCGPQCPFDRAAELALIKSGEQPSAIHNNCSGKHIGFLAAALALGASLEDYLNPEHPVQRLVMEHIQRISETRDIPIGMDGCSAPTYFITLTTLARMMQRWAAGDDALLASQFQAMTRHPHLIAGCGEFDTDFIAAMNGRGVAKKGAEGVQTVAIRDTEGNGFGLALKVLDGNSRPQAQVALEILKAFQLIDPGEYMQLANHYRPVYSNRADVETGTLVTTLDIVQADRS